jgi:hypothetical protein
MVATLLFGHLDSKEQGQEIAKFFLGKEILELTRLLQWLLPNHDLEARLGDTMGPRYRACAKVFADERSVF